MRGVAVDANRRLLQRTSPYGSFLGLPALEPDQAPRYEVPLSPEAGLNYRGLPYDRLEDMLPSSAAWKQVAPLLLAREGIATGRPITPLHGGHLGLLCTAGLLNGVFGKDQDRHIARWRSVKHVTTFTEDEGETQVVHHRERWTNELRLVYADGRTAKLTETPAKPAGESDGERTSEIRAA